MAAAEEKATPCCPSAATVGGTSREKGNVSGGATWPMREVGGGAKAMTSGVLIRPVEDLPVPPAKPSSKGIQVMARSQASHPLDPLSAAEISVAVATVRAAGETPEVRDSMRFVEVVLLEPEKSVVALADAYFSHHSNHHCSQEQKVVLSFPVSYPLGELDLLSTTKNQMRLVSGLLS
ncbi:hypothetical protein M5K25_003826 [Dendrobium thyrsiflorum]|uniref:Amine oxidase n=1 Tax=Dendrobium thyrsiflorum TaxID=117978 RepID=A0ABD0VKA1_DENTH